MRKGVIAKTTRLFEKYQKEGSLEWFDELEAIQLLLELVHCKGDRERISEELLDGFGSLKNVLEAKSESLETINGIGPRTASAIKMFMSFMRAWQLGGMDIPDTLKSSKEAGQYCKSLLFGERREKFYVICLNARLHVVGKRLVSEGDLSEVNAYPRVIIETVLNYNAHSVVLCHNHPGGTLSPSCEDLEATKRIQGLLKELRVDILDHIIVAGDEYYSMCMHGDL